MGLMAGLHVPAGPLDGLSDLVGLLVCSIVSSVGPLVDSKFASCWVRWQAVFPGRAVPWARIG